MGPQNRPDDECNNRDENDYRNKHTSNGIGQLLNRRAAALRVCDHLDNLGEQRIFTHTLGRHNKTARLVHRPAGHIIAFSFADRNRFAGDH